MLRILHKTALKKMKMFAQLLGHTKDSWNYVVGQGVSQLLRAGIQSMFIFLRHRRLSWLGQVHRMEDGRIPIAERAFPTWFTLSFEISLSAQRLTLKWVFLACS